MKPDENSVFATYSSLTTKFQLAVNGYRPSAFRRGCKSSNLSSTLYNCRSITVLWARFAVTVLNQGLLLRYRASDIYLAGHNFGDKGLTVFFEEFDALLFCWISVRLSVPSCSQGSLAIWLVVQRVVV